MTSLAWPYNRLGQMDTVTDYTGTRNLDHCICGKLVEETLSSFFGSRKLTYDLASTGVLGRTLGYTLSGASGTGTELDVDYAYRADGRLDTVASGKTFTYGYLANSHLVQAITENTTSFSSWRSYETHRDNLSYNNTTAGATTVSTFQHFFDGLGRLTYSAKSGNIFNRYDGGSLVTVYAAHVISMWGIFRTDDSMRRLRVKISPPKTSFQ